MKLTGHGQRGFVGIGIYQPKNSVNVGSLVRSARCFNANFVFTIGSRYLRESSAVKHERHIPVFHFASLEKFREAMPRNDDTRLIAVEIAPKSVPLHSFKHPERAIYLLGSEDTGLPAEAMKGCQIVQLPGIFCLNVAVTGSIVLYDREVKIASTKVSHPQLHAG